MKLIKFYINYLFRFLRYYWRAQTRYDIHGPFLARFIEEAIEDRRQYYAFSEIGELRQRLRQDRRTLEIRDYGAGSQACSGRVRRVGSLARYSGIAPRVGKILFRIVNAYQPRNVLELGTSLGISTLYLGSADSRAKIITIEGCPQTAAIASENLRSFRHGNIKQFTGSFRERLPEALAHLESIDLLFLDGDHRKDASVQYVETCLQKAHPDSIFVLADIHWSQEMEAAWRQLREHPRVRLSVDLFHIGILFFRREQRQTEHYTIIRSRFKPWRMGVFTIAWLPCCLLAVLPG